MWTHADQHLFFRHSDHLNAGVLSYLRSLNRASTHRDGERHDSQTSHFSGSPDPGRVKPDTSAHELRLDHVEGAFNGHEPDVDRIDDAIANEEEGWRHEVALRR